MPGEQETIREREWGGDRASPMERSKQCAAPIERAGFSRAECGEQASLFTLFLSTHLKTKPDAFRAPFAEKPPSDSSLLAKRALASEDGRHLLDVWQQNQRARQGRVDCMASRATGRVGELPDNAA